MATNNKFQISPYGMDYPLVCDLCDSNDIVKTESGYVCRSCGVMLDVQILEYHRPYNEDILQYAPLGKTQIGLKQERARNPQSYKMKRMNKIQSHRNNDESKTITAQIELNRIFEALSLPQADKDKIYQNFVKIHQIIHKGTKYRNPEKLIPLVLYFTYKFECKPISQRKLLAVSKISKKDFQAFKLQILEFWPEYKERDRKTYISRRIMEITENFGLGMYFYYQSVKIMHSLWNSLKLTKDNVIAGVCTSISALCLPNRPLTVSSICQRLNIRMSTIHSQVERKIFERLRVPGFESLVKSADILKRVIKKLGILMEEFEERQEEHPEIVEIKLGAAQQIFNPDNRLEYYLFALQHRIDTITFLSVTVDQHSIKEQFDPQPQESIKNRAQHNKERNDLLFNLEVWKIKGPPYILF